MNPRTLEQGVESPAFLDVSHPLFQQSVIPFSVNVLFTMLLRSGEVFGYVRTQNWLNTT
jgi:hypothetical protein